MNDSRKKVHFTKITNSEVRNKIVQLQKNDGEVIVWLKGRAIRESYRIVEVVTSKEIKVYPNKTDHLINNEVLIKFELGGQNYFSTAKFDKDKSTGFYILTMGNDFYKSERRSSYRLLTYPTYNVKIYFLVHDSYQGNNIVDIKSGQSETGIFKSFLNVIGQGDYSDSSNEITFRVQDLSTTGVSFVVGDIEGKYFSKDERLHDFKITFDSEEFIVSGAKIIYVIDYIQMNKKGLKQYKVGLEFDKLSTTMDSLLGNKIANVLRSNDANEEFEDFIE
jgi:hypothetical protein